MDFTLITGYSPWYIFLCFFAGAVYAAVLYFRERLLPEVSVALKRFMAFCRFFIVSLLAFFLMSPLMQIVSREVEKPIVVIAQDNSSSLCTGRDSVFYTHEYPRRIASLVEKLSRSFEVKTFSFGERISEEMQFSFDEKQTDMSALFGELSTRYSGRNLGAVIVAGDGLYNAGGNPVYAADGIEALVYTLALGDTTVRKDLVLSKVLHNNTVFSGNNFPLKIYVDAKQCRGAATTLNVSENGVSLFSKNIAITGEAFHTVVPVTLIAGKKGIHRYKITLSSVAGEVSSGNNGTDIFIEVTDRKEKILILSSFPHPDIATLKQSIEGNENYEVTLARPGEVTGFQPYNLIILYQLPSVTGLSEDAIRSLPETSIPLLYVLGTQSNLSQFNRLQHGLNILENRNKNNETQALFQQDFSLFSISDITRQTIPQLPPLITPFGNYKTSGNVYTLLSQQIGSVQTTQPLLFFGQDGNKKYGVLAGEGLWKWKQQEHLRNGNCSATNELIQKTVQYLSIRENKERFRIIGKRNFAENEPVLFDAEVYNESNELLNTPDVSIQISDAGNKNYPFTFSKTEKAYTLNAGSFSVGEYRYKATVKVGDKVSTLSGSFSVSPVQIEYTETTANHHLMNALAVRHDGKMFFPAQMDALAQTLLSREDISAVSYSEKKLRELIDVKALFFVLLLLVSIEWFMRKRSGAY